jgi:hypothetical protein
MTEICVTLLIFAQLSTTSATSSPSSTLVSVCSARAKLSGVRSCAVCPRGFRATDGRVEAFPANGRGHDTRRRKAGAFTVALRHQETLSNSLRTIVISVEDCGRLPGSANRSEGAITPRVTLLFLLCHEATIMSQPGTSSAPAFATKPGCSRPPEGIPASTNLAALRRRA